VPTVLGVPIEVFAVSVLASRSTPATEDLRDPEIPGCPPQKHFALA
jgi:hypothetical protein